VLVDGRREDPDVGPTDRTLGGELALAGRGAEQVLGATPLEVFVGDVLVVPLQVLPGAGLVGVPGERRGLRDEVGPGLRSPGLGG